jgi:cell division initiation protein
MLTPQEVSSHAFTKAVMGGYNMAMVDEFLDELTDDYTALYKENAALKAKMKVLVEKVEEYRATEDSMRATLLTAQRMADSIVKEAENKRDEIMAQAEKGAREKALVYARELEQAQERLRQGQQDLANFITTSRELCDREMRLLDELPQLPVETTAPAEETAAVEEEIEEKVMATFAQEETESAEPAAAAEAAETSYPEGDPFAKEDEEPTRRINLEDLKFGRNYSSDRQ